MSPLAFALILAAAGIHATWNFLVKRIGAGTAAMWMYGILSALCYAPLALWLVLFRHPQVGIAGYGFMLGSAVLHIGYFFFLQRGYREGDLSIVYPVARGTGPLITAVGAIFLLREQPAPVALLGTVMIGTGIFLLAGGLHFFRTDSPCVPRCSMDRSQGCSSARILYGTSTPSARCSSRQSLWTGGRA